MKREVGSADFARESLTTQLSLGRCVGKTSSIPAKYVCLHPFTQLVPVKLHDYRDSSNKARQHNNTT